VEGKDRLRDRHGWGKDNIKMNLREMGFEEINQLSDYR
jgi:hypothetical protein